MIQISELFKNRKVLQNAEKLETLTWILETVIVWFIYIRKEDDWIHIPNLEKIKPLFSELIALQKALDFAIYLSLM